MASGEFTCGLCTVKDECALCKHFLESAGLLTRTEHEARSLRKALRQAYADWLREEELDNVERPGKVQKRSAPAETRYDEVDLSPVWARTVKEMGEKPGTMASLGIYDTQTFVWGFESDDVQKRFGSEWRNDTKR